MGSSNCSGFICSAKLVVERLGAIGSVASSFLHLEITLLCIKI